MRVRDSEIARFGSAAFADGPGLRRAGLFHRTEDSLLIGFMGGQPIWYRGAGGMVLVAGARSGKLRDILAYNLCAGIYRDGSLVTLDLKGELAAISQNQTPGGKFCLYWNPSGVHGLPQHRINPVDYIRADSPSLVSDVKVFCENMIPLSGSAQGEFFEMRAREFLEALCLALTKRDKVLTLPALYIAINLIPANSEAWLDVAFEMNQSEHAIATRVEEEIANSRDDSTGGFRGIIGELFKAFSCLSDPVLMNSVSPHEDGRYDFSFSDLCQSAQAYQVYLMPPAEFVTAWAPVMKALFVSAMIYKAREPAAPRQTWILDECAQLKRFPLVQRLYEYGAGIGIRPWAVFQSTEQMNNLGPGAKNIILSSAACQNYFALRDIGSARAASEMLGTQTLEYDDTLKQGKARVDRQSALNAILHGEDPLRLAHSFALHEEAVIHRTKMARPLQTPDEVLNMPSDRQFIFLDDVPAPIFAERKPYYEQSFMAGRYFPNPYYPPANRVRVKRGLGHSWMRVRTERVPKRFAHFPQYASGLWSRLV